MCTNPSCPLPASLNHFLDQSLTRALILKRDLLRGVLLAGWPRNQTGTGNRNRRNRFRGNQTWNRNRHNRFPGTETGTGTDLSVKLY